jgi:hypothetical protein
MNESRCHEVVVGSSLITRRITKQFCMRHRLFSAPRAPARGAFVLCAKRQKGSLERTAKPQAHGSIPVAEAGRPDSNDTASATVGAGSWHCRKRSPEVKNGHACCQKGRLDGHTESDTSEQNNSIRSYGTFLHFQIACSGFCEWRGAAKNSPPRPRICIKAAIWV